MTAGVPGDWSGRGVLVTGGAAGIGLALGAAAARRGASVVLADIEPSVAEASAQRLREDGLDVSALACDVTDPASVARAVEDSVTRLGGLNMLCANAGVGGSTPISKMATVDEFMWVMQVNLFGVFYAIREAVPALSAAAATGAPANIVVTGSENSLGIPDYVPAMPAYQTSKHALLGLTDSIRKEMTELGVGVTLLCPSYVVTEGWNAGRNRPERFGGPRLNDPAVREKLAKLGQDPDEVAELTFAAVEEGAEIVVTREVTRGPVEKRARAVEDAFRRLAEATTKSDKIDEEVR
jgi:NAD(P)-dependent dehydrogenase (short-subunit alcohol dehydrogenase family)